MAGSSFKTNPIYLQQLLQDCRDGDLQLPDFQRSWVWDEDRIKSLIASVSKGFPIGALMALDTGGDVDFKPRTVEGAPAEAARKKPTTLLLDGQQRVTSLYQVALRGEVVKTITQKKKYVDRFFYIDMQKALDDGVDREDAIFTIPEDKVIKKDFGRAIELDLRTLESEFDNLMYPVSMVYKWAEWQQAFINHFLNSPTLKEKWPILLAFNERVIENFTKYQVPVITLGGGTSKEAVCIVFEKVNTGGKALDAFELVTAMYAADGHELRRDWYGNHSEMGRQKRLADMTRMPGQSAGILKDVSATDFLQAVSLFYTRDRRHEAIAEGKQGKELPSVTGNRQALLNLPLIAYKKYATEVERGFELAAKFLYAQKIFRSYDLPYQSQIVPLAAILADLKHDWDYGTNREKLSQWYWSGVFGELYGSSVDTRFARDFIEVPQWLKGGEVPSTIREATFRADRLKTMRMRLSAAYKGANTLLMREGAKDFQSYQAFEHTSFFGENVDIHHIFPRAWCESKGIKPEIYDSIINKTPLSSRTNIIIGGSAPSLYLSKLETGTKTAPPISTADLDLILASHLIDPTLLRTDNFEAFIGDRQQRLVRLVEAAMGKSVYSANSADEGVEAEVDDESAEAELTMST